MPTKESYNGVKDIAIKYPCVGATTSPTPLYEGQKPLTMEQHNLLQQARNKVTCTPETTAQARQQWNQMKQRSPDSPVSYSGVQQEWDDLITLFNIEPCLQSGDATAAVERIQEVSKNLCSYIKDNHPGPIDPTHKEYCKSENAIFYDNNKIGHPCPPPRKTPIFPDPAYNPQAKIATNELVKPYSATIFTQMERDKNVGREYPHPPAQHCKKECPRIQINPRNYNTQLEQQFNNNIKGHCFKKDFPLVNPTERNLMLNPNTFYKNFTHTKPTSMGQRMQIENAIRNTSITMFNNMNDSVIKSVKPVKQVQFAGAFQ